MRKASKAASVEIEPSAAITITTPYCMTSQSPKAPLFQGMRTAPKADSLKVKPSTGALAPSPAMSQYSKASYSRQSHAKPRNQKSMKPYYLPSGIATPKVSLTPFISLGQSLISITSP